MHCDSKTKPNGNNVNTHLCKDYDCRQRVLCHVIVTCSDVIVSAVRGPPPTHTHTPTPDGTPTVLQPNGMITCQPQSDENLHDLKLGRPHGKVTKRLIRAVRAEMVGTDVE